jgi:hypothetical protein
LITRNLKVGNATIVLRKESFHQKKESSHLKKEKLKVLMKRDSSTRKYLPGKLSLTVLIRWIPLLRLR